MCYLETRWIEEGFRIFVHDHTGMFEITIGENNERTDRYIRYGHYLFRMWENGEFEQERMRNEQGDTLFCG